MMFKMPLKDVIRAAHHFFADDIKPEQLIAFRVPERPFPQSAGSRIKKYPSHVGT